MRGGGDAAAALAALRVMHAAPEDLPAGATADAASAAVDATRPLSARNEAAARASLARAARAALTRYPSTLEQTERGLADATAAAAADAGADAAASERLAAALTVRAGEQRALAAVLRADGGDGDAAQPRRADADARAALRDASLL